MKNLTNAFQKSIELNIFDRFGFSFFVAVVDCTVVTGTERLAVQLLSDWYNLFWSFRSKDHIKRVMSKRAADDGAAAGGQPPIKKVQFEPHLIGPVSTLEELDIKVLQFQNKKLAQVIWQPKIYRKSQQNDVNWAIC